MKQRKDYSLKDTEKLYDAVRKTNTHVKDYSMAHVVQVLWEPTNLSRRTRTVIIRIGDEEWRNRPNLITDVVEEMIGNQQEDDVLFASKHWLEDYFGRKEMVIRSDSVNKEARVDHVAEFTIGKNTAIIDLEELLKATRYA